MDDLIYGSGKKGGGREPQNAEDNLNSKATARILEVISEGEISGFATPLEDGHVEGTTNYNTIGQKDIFFNRTPLLKPAASTSPTDADYNFAVNDLRIDTRVGKGTEADQPVINGFSDIRSVVSAFPDDDLVNKDEFKTLTFTDTATARVSQVVVIITIPALFAAYNNGDVRGLATHYEISRSISNVDGGAFATPAGMSVIVRGRTNDPFQQQHTIDIPPTSSTAVRTLQIKVTKIHGDHTDSNIIQQAHNVRFTSIVKVIDDERHYLNSALVGLQLDAENFSSVPRRTYKIKGIKIRIPGAGANNSGTPTVDIKTGRIDYPSNYIFNGTMQAAQFCACPVFVLYDILTSRRYGFGDQILTPSEQVDFSSGVAANIDLYSFVEASKYSNTLVSDNRDKPASQTGEYSQVGTTITITFPVDSKFQTEDLITCDFTSGNAEDISTPVRITSVKQNKTVITIEADDSQTTSGFVTVTTGSSNTEPRFSFNGVINKQEDAFKLLNKVASVFRGAIYFSEGKIKLTQDRPADPTYLFNRSNVTQEGFSYEGSDIKTRSNCVVVRFFNNISQKIDYEQHPLASDIDPSSPTFDPFVKAYGLNKKQVDAFGCTSGGQASRLARFIYYTENFLTETCTFTTTSDAGVMIRPGMIISISDPVRSGTRLAGRITAASTSSITVDSISGISFTSGDELSVVMPDGQVSKRPVTGISGSVISVSFNFAIGNTATAPNVNSVWLYEKTTVMPTTWRIISVEQSENLQYAVTALSYNSTLYNTIEGGTNVKARDITNLDEKVDSPSALTVRESLYKHVPNANTFATNNGNIRVQLRVTWPAVNGAVRYKVVYTQGANTSADSNFITTNPSQDNPINVFVRRNEFELRNVESGGVYVFEVQSINAAGLTSTVPVTTSHTVVGKSAPPSDVASLSATIDPNDGVGLNWIPVTPLQSNGFADLDLAGYEIRKGTDFADGTHPETLDSNGNPIVGSGIRVQATNLFLPVEFVKTTSTFMVKAYDTSGNFSTNAASTTVTINNPSAIVNPVQPSPTPNPLNTGVVKSAENGILKLTWNAPQTSTYKIKNYKIQFASETIFVDTTQFSTPITFAGLSGGRDFVITPVDIAGNEGTSHTENVSSPIPNAPRDLTSSFTTDSVILTWKEPTSAGDLQPPVIAYRIYRNENFVDEVEQINGTEFKLAVNSTNFLNRVATYHVAAVYLDPSNPVKGVASTNRANITNLTIVRAAAPSVSQKFELDFVILSWEPVNGSLPTLNYGIFNSNGDLLEQVDTTNFKIKADYNQKDFKIAAFSAAYHNATNSTDKEMFKGNETTFSSTRTNLDAPTKTDDGYALGSNGGLGFVTVSWIAPQISLTNNLDLKDFRIIRSPSSTFGGINLSDAETLELFTDALTFKEEVSWKLADDDAATSIKRYYYIQARDLLNNLGSALTIEVEINRPSTVPSEGISEVIDNNVLLRWGQPPVNANNQLKIDHYEIRKHTGNNTNWSTSTGLGGNNDSITDSRFSVVFETAPNLYTYLIKAYDVAGNSSLLPLTTLLQVAQPPDFVLNANYDSVFNTSGTGLTSPQEVDSVAFTNCLKVFDVALNKNVLYMPVLTNSNGEGTQTWAEHFIGTGSNASPQFANITAFTNANFTKFLEPAPTSGTSSYEEVFDYGTALASTKITVQATDLSQGTLGAVNLTSKLQIASGGSGGTFDGGVTTSGSGVSRFGVGLQRVKYTTTAVSTAGSLKKITKLNFKLDTKIKNDTGTGTANATDSGGTTVNFNVTFVDVQGIAVTPNTTSAVFAVVDFQDAPNPSSFKVLLYNTSGTRVNGNFTWQCRGT